MMGTLDLNKFRQMKQLSVKKLKYQLCKYITTEKTQPKFHEKMLHGQFASVNSIKIIHFLSTTTRYCSAWRKDMSKNIYF